MQKTCSKEKFWSGEQNQKNSQKQIKTPVQGQLWQSCFGVFLFVSFQYSCQRKFPCIFLRHLNLHENREARWKEGFSDSLTWRGSKRGWGLCKLRRKKFTGTDSSWKDISFKIKNPASHICTHTPFSCDFFFFPGRTDGNSILLF